MPVIVAVSSSPLRGAATWAARPPRSGTPSHHRPYEGQQLEAVLSGVTVRVPSSSPLRGQDRRTSGSVSSWERRVIIAPTRGSNCGGVHLVSAVVSPGHHRPYEGQQHAGIHDGTYSPHHAGHHRPYEGQQRRRRRRSPYVRLGSSSPLRGAATCSCRGPRLGRWTSSSPLRGAATVSATSSSIPCQFVIAPTRGSNMNISGDAPPAPPGHHRPYEGQQRGRERGGDRHDDGHHRPYEGQQHFRRRRQAACDPDPSSSPLRGAATPGRSWIPRLDCQVIIAPTRGSNKVSGSGHPTGAGGSIAPTRGSNVNLWVDGIAVSGRSSSPLRGAAT